MTVDLAALAENALETSWTAARSLAWLALAFAGLALITKGREAIAAARRALTETRINLSLFVLDTLVVLPLVLLMTGGIGTMVTRFDLALVGPDRWQSIEPALTVLAAVFLGDFISYWRHRFEHTRVIWPAHAIHHSDTAMTWLTLARFHPINRFVTVGVDTAFLALMGFPEWALVINNLVRHYYGHFIHADLPWTYGKLPPYSSRPSCTAGTTCAKAKGSAATSRRSSRSSTAPSERAMCPVFVTRRSASPRTWAAAP